MYNVYIFDNVTKMRKFVIKKGYPDFNPILTDETGKYFVFFPIFENRETNNFGWCCIEKDCLHNHCYRCCVYFNKEKRVILMNRKSKLERLLRC